MDEVLSRTPAFDLSPEAVASIRRVPYFAEGMYADLNLPLTFDYMRRRYVAPLSRRVDIAEASMADCACGFGWLSFTFLMSGGGQAILIDVDEPRLEAARRIAGILGLADRCTFVLKELQNLDWPEDSVDIFASVETLEHVGKDNIRPCIDVIARTASQAVLLTTPNFLFPVVAHDTQLPLAHWLPAPVRRRYARAMNREKADVGNTFLSPWHLRSLERKFRRSSRIQTFDSLEELDRFYPHYLPYGGVEKDRYRQAPKGGLRAVHKALASVLGTAGYRLAPNFAGIWLRRPGATLSVPDGPAS